MSETRIVWRDPIVRRLTRTIILSPLGGSRIDSSCRMGERPSCHLYQLSPVERLWNDLRALGIPIDEESVTLQVEDLLKADKMSYEGTLSQTRFLDLLKDSGRDLNECRILDVGAGFGGPARFLALKGGCKVTALELLIDISNAGARLSQRCGSPVADLVSHVPGDVLALNEESVYDGAHAVLSLLHVPHLPTALGNIFRALKPGGVFFTEDFHVVGALNADEKAQLGSRVGTSEVLMTKDEWEATLTECGFTNIAFEDVTKAWAVFTTARRDQYRASLEHKISVHGTERAEMMMEFFDTMSALFEQCDARSSGLGGARIVAYKPK